MKICVVGFSGSGKSTLSKRLGEIYSVPVLYCDTVHWLPNWVERDHEDENRIMEDFLDNNDGWVIDGNYSALSFDRRMEEADQIIYMNFNRFSCLSRAHKRYIDNKGKVRDSITEGCEEKFDREFIKWIMFDSRTKEQTEKYRLIKAKYPDKLIVIKDQDRLDKFIAASLAANFFKEDVKNYYNSKRNNRTFK